MKAYPQNIATFLKSISFELEIIFARSIFVAFDQRRRLLHFWFRWFPKFCLKLELYYCLLWKSIGHVAN